MKGELPGLDQNQNLDQNQEENLNGFVFFLAINYEKFIFLCIFSETFISKFILVIFYSFLFL